MGEPPGQGGSWAASRGGRRLCSYCADKAGEGRVERLALRRRSATHDIDAVWRCAELPVLDTPRLLRLNSRSLHLNLEGEALLIQLHLEEKQLALEGLLDVALNVARGDRAGCSHTRGRRFEENVKVRAGRRLSRVCGGRRCETWVRRQLDATHFGQRARRLRRCLRHS